MQKVILRIRQCLIAALLAWAIYRGLRLRFGADRGAAPVTEVAASKVGGASAPLPAVAAHALSFEERLAGKEGAGDRRGPLLLEWIWADRTGAMRFLAANRYRDLSYPGLAYAVARKATVAELLAMANGAETAYGALMSVGRYLPANVINAFANMMSSVNPDAAAQTTQAMGSLLAGLNVDRSVAFAMSQPTDALRASAIEGVFQQLRSTASGESEVKALYASLPPVLQSNDHVLFEYGNAVWGSDPSGALQALENIGDPRTRMSGLIVLSHNAASASPEIAVAAVYASGLTEQGIYNHVSQILQNWNALDPQGAANFLATTQVIPSASMARYRQLLATPPGG
jgi:hypothetical protein